MNADGFWARAARGDSCNRRYAADNLRMDVLSSLFVAVAIRGTELAKSLMYALSLSLLCFSATFRANRTDLSDELEPPAPPPPLPLLLPPPPLPPPLVEADPPGVDGLATILFIRIGPLGERARVLQELTEDTLTTLAEVFSLAPEVIIGTICSMFMSLVCR